MQLCDLDLLFGADRNDLLREHVERVARNLRLLDQTRTHPLHDDGRLEQVGAKFREDPALRHRVQRVTRATDALQAARDRLRRLDLDHEIDRAHVDAELERRRRDETRNAARLQVFLDDHALLARQRAVVRARNLILGQLVQPQRQPLREPAIVHEDDRRAVRAHQLEQRRIDRGPDGVHARPHFEVECLTGRTELAHVFDRDDDFEVELLRDAGVDELHWTAAADEATDLFERPLRRGEPDALQRPVTDETLQALERQREMRAAFRARDCMHLVDDHGVDRAQQLARAGGQHQEE